MPLVFADPSDTATPIHVLSPSGLPGWLDRLPPAERNWAETMEFSGKLGQTCVLPREDGTPGAVLIGAGDAAARARSRFAIGAAIAGLPKGEYALQGQPDGVDADEIGLGYLLSLYRFDRYREQAPAQARLVAPKGVEAARLEAIAAGEALTRDLINTPAEDMGPDALAEVAQALAAEFDADLNVTVGEDLLKANFPLIHTVGRAADRAPRLIELRWGEGAQTLTLVGKGVCFDTGGLNLKPGSSMALMKKDMGGAATVLGLARMIMALDLDLKLRVLIPAVENAVSGNAFRPGDILTARNGMTVEINNTDAEGRLVLADALAFANESPSDLTVCMATLTGAARVAVGPDIAPFYTDDGTLAAALTLAAQEVADPVWRMPFHAPYETMIEPGIADLDNAPKGGFAGSITAALFLRRFVPDCASFVHFDIYGWQPSAAPARPKGGVGQGARAILASLSKVLSA